MQVSIISKHKEFNNRELQQYVVDGTPHVGVWGDEPYAVRLSNDAARTVEARLSIDGTDVLTGQPASREPTGPRWVLHPHQTMLLEAWPEDQRGGARFVFRHAEGSVAAHVRGDTSNLGVIAVAVFTEGYVPPTTCRARSSRGCMSGLTRSAGTGAGERVTQRITTATGLTSPRYSYDVCVRYMWADELEKMLRARGLLHRPPSPYQPDGFPGDRMTGINLGSTPRPTVVFPAQPAVFGRVV